LSISEVLRNIGKYVVRKLATEQNDRPWSLVYSLHIIYQFRAIFDECMFFVVLAPFFDVVVKTANTLKSACFRMSRRECENSLNFSEFFHLRNKIAFTKPILETIIVFIV